MCLQEIIHFSRDRGVLQLQLYTGRIYCLIQSEQETAVHSALSIMRYADCVRKAGRSCKVMGYERPRKKNIFLRSLCA